MMLPPTAERFGKPGFASAEEVAKNVPATTTVVYDVESDEKEDDDDVAIVWSEKRTNPKSVIKTEMNQSTLFKSGTNSPYIIPKVCV